MTGQKWIAILGKRVGYGMELNKFRADGANTMNVDTDDCVQTLETIITIVKRIARRELTDTDTTVPFYGKSSGAMAMMLNEVGDEDGSEEELHGYGGEAGGRGEEDSFSLTEETAMNSRERPWHKGREKRQRDPRQFPSDGPQSGHGLFPPRPEGEHSIFKKAAQMEQRFTGGGPIQPKHGSGGRGPPQHKRPRAQLAESLDSTFSKEDWDQLDMAAAISQVEAKRWDTEVGCFAFKCDNTRFFSQNLGKHLSLCPGCHKKGLDTGRVMLRNGREYPITRIPNRGGDQSTARKARDQMTAIEAADKEYRQKVAKANVIWDSRPDETKEDNTNEALSMMAEVMGVEWPSHMANSVHEAVANRARETRLGAQAAPEEAAHHLLLDAEGQMMSAQEQAEMIAKVRRGIFETSR